MRRFCFLYFPFFGIKAFHIYKGVFLEMAFVFDIGSTLVITLPLVQLESGTPAHKLPIVNQRCSQRTRTILILLNQAVARFILCLNPEPFRLMFEINCL